jgi:hypothetical protein
MIAEHLAANPKIEFTAPQLGNILRRSSGAIANALITLCERDEATQTGTVPRTYRTTRARARRTRR